MLLTRSCMTKSILFVLLFIHHSWSIAQVKDVHITGTLKTIEKIPIDTCTVALCQNNDTLLITQTNSKGEFQFNAQLLVEQIHHLKFNRAELSNQMTRFYVPNDSTETTSFYFELILPVLKQCRFDNSAYYDLNETVRCQNFDTHFIKNITLENPGLCLSFTQTIHPNESLRTAKKRMKNFKKLLKIEDFDLSRIEFSDEIRILDLTSSEDHRSRIQGVVVSLEGDCY